MAAGRIISNGRQSITCVHRPPSGGYRQAAHTLTATWARLDEHSRCERHPSVAKGGPRSVLPSHSPDQRVGSVAGADTSLCMPADTAALLCQSDVEPYMSRAAILGRRSVLPCGSIIRYDVTNAKRR
jgi:hypothetical protein